MTTNFSIRHINSLLLLVITGSILVLNQGCHNMNKATNAPENNQKTGTQLKRKLKAGESHLYSIHLKPDDFLHIKAEQYDMDLIAKVSSPDGQFAEQFDSPNGELDAEDIYLISDKDRKYTIEIYPAQKYADPGDYVLSIVRTGKATETEKKWMDALAATQKADKMRAKPDTRQQSIQQYQSAMTAWEALREKVQYARAMRSMGFVHIRLKNYQKAVDVFTQLLPLWKQVGDNRAEGFTQLIIGRIYDLQKEYKKSLEYNLNSLPYWVKTKDSDQESFTLMNIGNLYSYLGDQQKTIDYFEQALKKNEQSERPSIKAVIIRDYANSLMRLNNDEKAIQLYEQSIKLWQATVNTPEEARTAIQLADYFSKKANQKEAVRYYRHALTIWEKNNDQDEIKKIQEALGKLEK